MTTARLNLIESAIQLLLVEELQEQKHEISPEEFKMVPRNLTLFVGNAVSKYIKGSKEHGGDLLDDNRDLAMEIYQETIDLFWYTTAMRTKRNNESQETNQDNSKRTV